MLTAQQRQSYIDQIRALPEQLTALVHDLSEEQLTTPYLTGEWTVAQNVHHLADSHMNSYIRCKLIATEDNPPLKPYDQDQWATFADATAADVSVSLQLLSSLHTRWVIFWGQLSEETWQRTGHHPENGIVSLEQQVQLYAEHGLAHIDQLQRTLAAQSAE
ncbi:MAG: putative metal-dependent hydrolase [Chloroflexi bacterium AL-W]|nr:putative metal-dependent hydrolase [Chloroflexi bacterium AL-N1]NOK64850.1 putative metal-dependent hydrolase [Chloroflexi bacterium AL-N10]NOK76620.1 putative metal-dependent hydrolase [Chloroflexi bacterium AL-N5]NOK80151.1 putative metal-dependent hydrolase [Chloroflexi bacterium AL-W]NOK86664.1 putative metal-dependent hydrolase [Chloroflexi bacterium AL-N15]